MNRHPVPAIRRGVDPPRSYSDGVAAGEIGCWWGHTDKGVVVEVRCPRSVEHHLWSRWPPRGLHRTSTEPAEVRLRLEVRVDWTTGETLAVVDGAVMPGAWERIESDLALFASEHLAGLVAVHAAVVVHDGRAVVLPGVSGSGKSTLSVAATAAGLTLLSDEYALVDPSSGAVTGWVRPVRLRRPGGVIERLDLAVESSPVPVALVALLRFEPGADCDWHEVPPSEGVLGLMANTVCAQSRPDESFDAALAVMRSARCVSGMRGEADIAVQRLLVELDR